MAEPVPIIQGDSPTFRFEVKDTAEDPFNLNDYNADFFIKRSLQDTDKAAEFHGELGDGIALAFTEKDGILDVTIPATVTQNLRIGRAYPFYLRLTHSVVTTRVLTPARGAYLPLLPNAE